MKSGIGFSFRVPLEQGRLGRGRVRAVVGADAVDRPVGEPPPEGRRLPPVPQRRRADRERAALGVVVEPAVEDEVLRAGLDVQAEAGPPRAPRLAHGLGDGGVDHVERVPDEAGEADRAGEGLGLAERGARLGVARPGEVALAPRLRGQGGRDRLGLGVDEGQGAGLAGGAEGGEHGPVVGHQPDLGVGQVELEGGAAGRDGLGEPGEVRLLLHAAVDREVDRGLRHLLAADRAGLRERAPGRGVREVEEGRDPAVGGRDGLGVEVVRGREAEKVVLDVHVRLDAARQDVEPGRVDHPPGRAGHRPDGRDPPVQDRDVSAHHARRRDHEAAPDDQVVHASVSTGDRDEPLARGASARAGPTRPDRRAAAPERRRPEETWRPR